MSKYLPYDMYGLEDVIEDFGFVALKLSNTKICVGRVHENDTHYTTFDFNKLEDLYPLYGNMIYKLRLDGPYISEIWIAPQSMYMMTEEDGHPMPEWRKYDTAVLELMSSSSTTTAANTNIVTALNNVYASLADVLRLNDLTISLAPDHRTAVVDEVLDFPDVVTPSPIAGDFGDTDGDDFSAEAFNDLHYHTSVRNPLHAVRVASYKHKKD